MKRLIKISIIFIILVFFLSLHLYAAEYVAFSLKVAQEKITSMRSETIIRFKESYESTSEELNYIFNCCEPISKELKTFKKTKNF